MSTVARRFIASPARLSSATWKVISELICKADGEAKAEFAKVSGVGSSLINDKRFAGNPMVVKNKGPLLRVYCLYGEDAISGEDSNEEVLSWEPTAKEWHVYLPCDSEEIKEMAAILKGKSSKFDVYDPENGVPDDAEEKSESKTAANAAVDWEAFKKL